MVQGSITQHNIHSDRDKPHLYAGVEAGPEPLKYGCNPLSSFAEGVQDNIHMQVGRAIVPGCTSRMP